MPTLNLLPLRGGAATLDPRCDRVPLYDPKSLDYRIFDVVAGDTEADVRPKTWPVHVHLDQRRDGACVAFGLNHELAAEPVHVVGRTNTLAKYDYWDIQRRDPWPGGAYPGADPRYDGTALLPGAQLMKERGWYESYHWAKTELEIALAVSTVGPVVIAVNWWQGMMDPDADGYLRPRGGVVGGHCTLLHAIEQAADGTWYYWVWQSWGHTWGLDGKAKLKRADMAALLRTEGEAMLPLRTAKTR